MTQAHKGLRVIRAIKDCKGYKELKVDLDMMVHKGLRVIKVIRVIKGRKDQEVSKVTRETKVTKETPDRMDLKVIRGIPKVVVDYPIPVLRCNEPST